MVEGFLFVFVGTPYRFMLMEQDFSLQVISARKGEFETGFERGGQTREHAMLAKTAGVKHLIVLINKMDDSTVQWSEKRYNECKEKLVPYLKKVRVVGFCVSDNLLLFPSHVYSPDQCVVFCHVVMKCDQNY